jgi:secreted trypsin-like serine protease
MPRFIRITMLAALALPFSAAALLIRPDREDSEYLEMATKYVSSVALDVPGGGEGVLIHERWVLTSARVGAALKAMKTRPPVKIGTRDIKITDVYVHPAWRPGANSGDIALVYLASAAKVEPTLLHRADDEAGKSLVIVGHGDTGRIGAKATTQDHKMRAGINTVDRLSPKIFAMTVKKGDDASDLQAAFTASESGAPAYFQAESGELSVTGVASSSKDENSDSLVDTGDSQVFIRVSAYAQWIDDTMDKVAKEEVKSLLDSSRGS